MPATDSKNFCITGAEIEEAFPIIISRTYACHPAKMVVIQSKTIHVLYFNKIRSLIPKFLNLLIIY